MAAPIAHDVQTAASSGPSDLYQKFVARVQRVLLQQQHAKHLQAKRLQQAEHTHYAEGMHSCG